MTTKTLNGKTILAWEVPDGAYGIEISMSYFKSYLFWWGKDGEPYSMQLGGKKTQWSILGRAKDITEEQARGLVGWFELAGTLGYKDYSFDDPRFPFKTALESFHSWLRSEGIKETDLLLIKNS